MLPQAIIPARVDLSSGAPWSLQFGDRYYPEEGGPGQSRHVFLGGNGLPQRWRRRETFTILETGFGLGLNFLQTWQTLRLDHEAPRRLHFVSLEKHPLNAADLELVHRRWPELASLSEQLTAVWPPLAAGLNRLHFELGRVTLTLAFGDAAALLEELQAPVDALYLDGFAPSKNPELWSQTVCRELARLARPGATLATWCVATQVRANLAAAGFELEIRSGYGRKREMLCGAKPGRPPAVRSLDRRAAVIGGGLAGTCVAERLASRGWRVALHERHAALAQEASGNRTGVLQPALNLADAPNARFARAAFLYALRHFDHLRTVSWRRSGVLRLAIDEENARLALIIEKLALPPELVRTVVAAEAAMLAGHEVRRGGLWFPQGAWAHPGTVCEAAVAREAERIKVQFDDSVSADHFFEVPLVVDASGSLLRRYGLPLVPVRGQVTYLPTAHERRLDIAVTGEGYIAPLSGGGHCIGATFDHDDADHSVRAADHTANLARLEAMLPGFARGLDVGTLEGRVGYRITTPDRMPVFGEVRPGIMVATGLGARGLLWAPLAAEVLASQLEDEPLPVERSLAQAIGPQRFHSELL
jgi:tRNA 5-methylaminomethyl-2-thiouridine biosynthesis bifunctional protein